MRFLGKIYNRLFKKTTSINNHNIIDNKKIPFFLKTPLLIPNLGILILFIMILTGYRNTVFDIYVAFVCGYCIFFSVLVSRAPYVPGAFDNGVAAAMVVDLADHFLKNPLKNTSLVFLNTGCEEDAIKGITHFIKTNNLNKESTYFLNLESIGAEIPVICYAESDLWTGWPLKYDRKGYAFAKKVMEGKSDFDSINETFIPAPSDMVVVVKKGYKVLTQIASVSKTGFPEQYHQMFDVEDRLYWDTIEISRKYAIELIKRFDEEFESR